MRVLFLTLATLANIYSWIYLVYIMIGFFSADRSNILIRAIDSMCVPVDNFVDSHLPKVRAGMMDFSPIYVLVACMLLEALFKYLAKTVH